MTWSYEKLDEKTGKKKYLPMNDFDGKVTGKIVFGVKNYFDENPGEARRLGWIKHIHHTTKEIKELVGDWNRQTQTLMTTTRQVDEWTIEDQYHVVDKSEEQILFEELQSVSSNGDFNVYDDGVIWMSGSDDDE